MRHLPALLIGLVGAVAVLTAAATPAVACWLPKPPTHDCAFPFGGSSPFHGSKTCSTPTPSHTVTPPATHGVQAVTDTPISAPPTAIPTGVTAGGGMSTALPLITEIAGTIGVTVLMLALVLSYSRRPGSHL
jgi:hypothetical protein